MIPDGLTGAIYKGIQLTNLGSDVSTVGYKEFSPYLVDEIFNTLEGFFIYLIKHKLAAKDEIKKWFDIKNKSSRRYFYTKIDKLFE